MMKPDHVRHRTPNRTGGDNSSLRKSVIKGFGEWSAVPECVREAISELLAAQDGKGTTSRRGSKQRHHSLMRSSGERERPANAIPSTSTATVKHSSPFGASMGLSPLVPLTDDGLLLSVRTFEDVDILRQHAVRNTALFHNNVEQLARDVRAHLVPELRASIQLHPLIVQELKARDVGGETPNVSCSSTERMNFEDGLLGDVLDALHALRKASVRFTANYFTDDEKRSLGIDPRMLPREEGIGMGGRSGLGRTPTSLRNQDDDETTVIDRRHPTDDRGTFVSPTKRSAERGNHNYNINNSNPNNGTYSSHARVVCEEEEEPLEDRSPRRSRYESIEIEDDSDAQLGDGAARGETHRSQYPDITKRERGAEFTPRGRSGSNTDVYFDPFVVEDAADRGVLNEDDEPRVSPHEKTSVTFQARQNARCHEESFATIALQPSAHASSTPAAAAFASPSRMLEMDKESPRNPMLQIATPASSQRVGALNAQKQSAKATTKTAPTQEVATARDRFAPPPPFQRATQRALDEGKPMPPLSSPIHSDRRYQLPPTSPSAHLTNSSSATVSAAPSAQTGSAAVTRVISDSPNVNTIACSEEDSDDRPMAVPPPGTPKTRNDFVVITPPRGISVKKKTLLVPRGSSMDGLESSIGGSPRNHSVPQSPANSMHSSSVSHSRVLSRTNSSSHNIPPITRSVMSQHDSFNQMTRPSQ